MNPSQVVVSLVKGENFAGLVRQVKAIWDVSESSRFRFASFRGDSLRVCRSKLRNPPQVVSRRRVLEEPSHFLEPS